MEALRASCMMISSEFEWRVGVGLADACLPLHTLRSVQIRFKGLRQPQQHSLLATDRNQRLRPTNCPLTAGLESIRAVGGVMSAVVVCRMRGLNAFTTWLLSFATISLCLCSTAAWAQEEAVREEERKERQQIGPRPDRTGRA